MSFNARRIKNQYQPLTTHLENVACLCERFCLEFGHENFGTILGMLHDIGKYSTEFQNRLSGANIKVDHATAGAKECLNVMTERKFLRLIAPCILGHHTGLQNFGPAQSVKSTLMKRCNEYSIEYRENALKEIDIEDILSLELRIDLQRERAFIPIFLFNYVRFLFSSLVDADRLDAENFQNDYKNNIRNTVKPAYEFYEIFFDYIKKFDDQTGINKYRNQILSTCIEKGLFLLNVPTGGGKTISSMAFALEHLKTHHMKRIIYSIPFTSIIEQNAGEFSDIFGQEHVLEHHHQFENPFRNNSINYTKLELAVENWDMPFIVTTNVQFFETLFAKQASKVRKLHNIANSVIVLDEVQAIPFSYLKPCMEVIADLIKNFNCTVVFSSATQMDYDALGILPNDITPVYIIDNPKKLIKQFERVRFNFIGKKNIQEISNEINQHMQVLTIVNTKKHAKLLYDECQDKDNLFCLSTNLCPFHRKEIIKNIKDLLTKNKPITVISTQLLEAGVDLDFPVVYRALTGIDSIIQAGGRCNREGKLEEATCYHKQHFLA